MTAEFWVAGVMGVALAFVGAVGRRRRRFVTGLLLVAVAVLAALMAWGGTLPRGRSYLFVAPAGSTAAAQRLAERLGPTEDRGRQQIRFARLAPGPADGVGEEVFGGDQWLVDAARAARPGWWNWALAGFPRPTVIVPYDAADFWRSPAVVAGAGAEDPGAIAAVFRDAGAELRVVDCNNQGHSAGAGRLTVALTSPRIGGGNSDGLLIPAWSSDRIQLKLEGCPYPAIDDRYTVRAWVDRRWPVGAAPAAQLLVYPPPATVGTTPSPNTDGQLAIDWPIDPAAAIAEPPHGHMRLGSRPEEARRATLAISKFAPVTQAVGVGFHRIDIELAFDAAIDGLVVPLTYRATEHFEVDDTSLVLLHDPSRGLATRHSWTHRPGSIHVAPPGPAGALDSLLNDYAIRWRVPDKRLPFARMAQFDLSKWNDPFERAEAEKAIRRASMVLLMDPTWEQVRAVDPILRIYVDEQGGTVMTALPPEPKAGDEGLVPPWLPAVGAPTDGALDEHTDARVYFVLDASRPASKFATADGTSFAVGGRLQADIVNAVYASLAATDRSGSQLINALVGPGVGQADITVTPTAASVALFGAGAGRIGLIVPPLIARLDTSAAALVGPAYSVERDAASSWLSGRLWTLDEVHRGPLYDNALKPLRGPPAPPHTLLPTGVFDAPLRRPHAHRGSVVVAFALNVRQPNDDAKVWTKGWGGTVWTTADSRADASIAGPVAVDPKTVTKTGATLIVVPIQLSTQLTETFDKVVPHLQGKTLRDAIVEWEGELLSDAAGNPVGIDLSKDDAWAEQSAKATGDRLVQVLKERLAQPAAKLEVRDHGRAIDARVKSPADAPRIWRRMRSVAHDGITPPAAAVVTGAGGEAPAIVWRPTPRGAAIALAYSPVSHDLWYRDGGPSLAPLSTDDVSPAPGVESDGWGPQRLCDPIALAAGAPTRPLTIDSIRASADETTLLLDCVLASDAVPTEVPDVVGLTGQPVDAVVSIADLDVPGRRVTFSISPAAGGTTLNGDIELRWGVGPRALKAGPMFVRLRAGNDPARQAREALATVAGLSGGRAVPEHQFGSTLGANFSAAWVGATGLIVVVTLTLSPLARRWRPLPRLRRRRGDADISARDDSASLEAAFDSIGASHGSPAAQRPAGRQLQIRVMRSGDPAVAARRSEWAYFIPEIADRLGSPPLPRVIETPRLESLSIVTLIDWPPGAGARDTGGYEDRVRAMARVATLNAIVASRRGGMHYVLAMQDRTARDAVEPAPPGEAALAVARVVQAAQHAGGRRALPELLPGEAVVLVTNPASEVDLHLEELARRCVEDRCPLAVVLLTHPMQRKERGLMRRPGSPLLLDRNDLDSAEVDAFLQRRTEKLKALAGMAEGRVCAIRTDQPIAELAVVLTEAVWEAN